MKNLLILVFVLSSLNFVSAQYAGGGTPTTTAGNVTDGVTAQAVQQYLGSISDAMKKRKELVISDAQGSPYTSFKFAPTALFYGDEKIGNFYYRYNALNEEIEIKKTQFEDEDFKGLTNDKKITVLVNGKKMAFKTFVTSKNRTTNGYLTKLFDGEEYDLYKRTTVKFTEAQDAQNSFVTAVAARFTQFTEYYYQKESVNRIDEVVAKNSKFLKLLDDTVKAKTKAFLKENDLNMKNEADLIKAFEFLNEK